MTTTNNQLPVDKQPLGDICIPLFVPDDPEWLWYVIKCLSFPTAKRFWVKDEAVDIEAVRKEWENRVYIPFVNRALAGETCPEVAQGDCVEYNARAGFITWFPINPFYDSSIPSGYVQPPFFLWQNILPNIIPDFIEEFAVDALGFTGYENNDVLTALWAFPFFMNWFNEFSGGFPRFTVQVQGQGSVELHLLNVPLGGRCLITVDVEFNPLDIINGLVNEGFNMVELNKDVFAAPPELESVHIVEIELPDNAQHTIHVTFLPTVNDSFDFINFGGGLRKVVLCGVTPIGETEMDCIDVLDCIEQDPLSAIALRRNSNLGLPGGVWTNITWDEVPVTGEVYNSGGAWLPDPTNIIIQHRHLEATKAHLSASAHLTSATASNKGIRILNEAGVTLAAEVVDGTNLILNCSCDYEFQVGEHVTVQLFSATAGTALISAMPIRFSCHALGERGLTGAQGNAGVPGGTGATGTVPPELEYLFFENIITNTNIFLENLEDMYTDSPQDIDAAIPTLAPDDTQDIALCKALSAWVFTYVEAKKARIRGASFLNQVWGAMTDVMHDAYTLISGVIGWNPLEGVFGCVVDNETALAALLDADAVNQVICCLWGELMDIALLTTSLEGAINACENSLAGTAHDIICMLQSDLNLQHTLNFYYLYGKALTDDVITACACGGYSYIEYDFTISDWGFVGINAVYVAGVGWEGVEVDPDGDNISRHNALIRKSYAGALPKAVAAGYVMDAVTDCGLSNQSIDYYLDDVNIQGMGIGGVSQGNDQHRTFANSTHVTVGKVLDALEFRLSGSKCNGEPALMRWKKVRLWLDQTSQLTGTPSENAPLGTVPNGTTDMIWWE